MTSAQTDRRLEPAGPALVVREARPDEWAEAGMVVQAAYRGDDDPATLDAANRAYLEHVADVADRARTCTILVADLDGELAGCLTLVPGPESPYAETERPGEAGIRMLGVDPRRQGRGVGRALMRAAIERARAAGARRLTLVVRADNPPAHALYRGLGFRRAPGRDFSPSPATRSLTFSLPLAAPSTGSAAATGATASAAVMTASSKTRERARAETRVVRASAAPPGQGCTAPCRDGVYDRGR